MKIEGYEKINGREFIDLPKGEGIELIDNDIKQIHYFKKAQKSLIRCPECKNEMTLLETWDSLLGMATWYKYGCEYCGGIFEVKRGKEKAKEVMKKNETNKRIYC